MSDYWAEVARHLDAVQREGGGLVQSGGAPIASYDPNLIPPGAAAMSALPPPAPPPAAVGPPMPAVTTAGGGGFGAAIAKMPGEVPFGPPAPPNVGGEIPAPAQAPANPNEYHLMQVGGGGVTPAHEVEMRGPQLKAAQGRLNATTGGAIDSMEGRSLDAAGHEYNMYLQQERQARVREDAANASMAERDAEMQMRQADFDQSVKALSKMQLDPDRFWASRSTGQKVAGMVSIALGGFMAGSRGGPNTSMDMINTAIERDIKAQEFGYHAARDTVNAKQTAFTMAMQKYQSVDAARSMARAAALDGVQAQIAQQGALWKGTDAANHADAMLVNLEQQKTQQIQQGVAFVQAQASGRKYVDPKTGLVYSEQEAKALAKETRDQEFKMQEHGATTAGQMMVAGAKATEDRKKDVGERTVVVDGQEQVAKSKPAAEKWDKYTHARTVFSGALTAMKEARASGDVGKYEAARATVIETYPELLGYTRAPTEGQIKVTVGPEAVPEYNHWFHPLNVATMGGAYGFRQGRADQKMAQLDQTLNNSDKAMRDATFGRGKGSAPNTADFVKFSEGKK